MRAGPHRDSRPRGSRNLGSVRLTRLDRLSGTKNPVCRSFGRPAVVRTRTAAGAFGKRRHRGWVASLTGFSAGARPVARRSSAEAALRTPSGARKKVAPSLSAFCEPGKPG
ncbi:hypothetical protein MRX96_046717 [Rhipicephalus microplus]